MRCHHIQLYILGEKHENGRVDLGEDRFVGFKSLGVDDTPGGMILHIAHRALSLTLDREMVYLRKSLMPRHAEQVYDGFWSSSEHLMAQTVFDRAQQDVTGTIRRQRYKGNCTITSRKSDQSLFQQHFATFEEGSGYNQQNAGGFRLNALHLATRTTVQKTKW
jgi:argininosuccinate synthase